MLLGPNTHSNIILFALIVTVDYGIVALDKFPFEKGIGQIDHNVLTSNK